MLKISVIVAPFAIGTGILLCKGWGLAKTKLAAANVVPATQDDSEDNLVLTGSTNANEIIDGLMMGIAPYKVLESRRFLDGDAFLVGVASILGDAHYAVIYGLRPTLDEPNFEESRAYFRKADEEADDGNLEALDECLNFRYSMFSVPDDIDERKLVRTAMVSLLQAREEHVTEYATCDVDGIMSKVAHGWLFTSPKHLGRRAIADLQ